MASQLQEDYLMPLHLQEQVTFSNTLTKTDTLKKPKDIT
jgi:hypothetical protein